VLVVLRASTAAWIEEYCPLVADLLTTRAPDGGDVRLVASASPNSENKDAIKSMLTVQWMKDQRSLDVSK
jgi:hypothetical protein